MMVYQLHEETMALVKEERRLTGVIVDKLRKNSDEKLYLKMGYSSLFDYATRGLGYSESCAYRRISAVKIVREIPELRDKLDSGTINLTNLTMAQSFFSRSKVKTEMKKKVISKIENCTRRETEIVLAGFGDEKPRQKEAFRQITETTASLRVELNNDTIAKLERLKNLRSHKNSKMSFAELINDMANYMLRKLEPTQKAKTSKQNQSPQDFPFEMPNTKRQENRKQSYRVNRHIPKSVKAKIWTRDQGQCTYQDPLTDHRCQSKHLLQFDHVVPVWANGEATAANLRLLCHAHHSLRALEDYAF